MKTYRVHYQTKLLESKEGAEIVEASGKGQAMLAAQMRLHPDVRPDEPYFHFEPLTIRLLDTPGTYEVCYRTKIEIDKTGTVEVKAETPDKAVSKARLTVHKELIPPKCFKAVEITEISNDGA